MRIAISGSACQGKTTLVNDMLKEWPLYSKSIESHRKLVRDGNIPVNKMATKDGQWAILNALADDLKNTRKGDKVIFDRCPIDNLVYSMWAEDKKSSDIDKEFISKCIPIVAEAMRHVDILFFIPITNVAPVKVEQKEGRDIDPEYITEIDNIFKAIEYQQYKKVCPFFVRDDQPPILELYGNRVERIQLAKQYLDVDGDLIDTQQSVLSHENIQIAEQLVREQVDAHVEEKKIAELANLIIRPK